MDVYALSPYQISHGSLHTTIKPRAEYRFHAAAILFYTTHIHTQRCILF